MEYPFNENPDFDCNDPDNDYNDSEYDYNNPDYEYNDIRSQSIPLDRNLVLFGLGGAGKSLVFSLMNQTWFLKYYLSEPSRSLAVHIIDSANGDKDSDKKTICRIYRKIKNVKRNYSHPGTITIDYEPITDKITQLSDLASTEIRQIIKAWYKAEGKDNNVWWLEDPEKGLDNFFVKLVGLDSMLRKDFTAGVYRRRGIAKALFYLYLAKGSLNKNFGRSTVSIVVGLGGGTGSGIFIDLAKYLKSRCGVGNITLYGILPSEKETLSEKQNAFAALAELEYMSLEEDGVSTFSRIVLVPLDPTGYGGGHSTRLSPPLEEFSDMFNYIIASTPALNNPTADDKCKRYSTFILATGGVLKYSITPIRKTRVEVGNLPEKYSNAIASEKKFRSHLANMLEGFPKTETKGVLTVDDMEYLRKYVDRIRFWNNESFLWMNYSSIEYLRKNLPGIYDPQNLSYRSSEDILSDLKLFRDTVSAVRSQSEKIYIDDNDKMLIDVFSDALDLLDDTVSQLLLISSLDSPSKNMLKSLARFEYVDQQVMHTVRRDISVKNSSINHCCDARQSAIDERDELEKLPTEASVQARNILETYNLDLETREIISNKILGSINEAEKSLQSLLNQLKNPPTDKFTFSKQAKLDDWNIYTESQFSKLKSFLSHKEFEDFFDLIQIIIDYYFYVHMRDLFYNKVNDNILKNTFNRITGVKKEHERDYNNYNNRVTDIKNKIDNHENLWGLKWVSDVDNKKYDIELKIKEGVQFHIDKYLRDEDTKIANGISQGVGIDLFEEMMNIFKNSKGSSNFIKEKGKEAIVSSILANKKYSKRKEDLDAVEKKISSEITKFKDESELLSKIIKIGEDCIKEIGTIKSMWDAILSKEHDIKEVLLWMEKSQEGSGENYTFAKRIINVPPEITAKSAAYGENLGAIAHPSKIGEPQSASVVRQILSDIQNMMITKLFEPRYLGISRMNIEYGKNNLERWSLKNVIVTMHSTFGDLNSQFCDNIILEDTISQKVSSAHISWNTLDHASPWDVGVTVFVMPLFLDNIMNIESLRNAFDSRMTSKSTKNILHSVLFLEEGRFIDKRKGINAPKAAEISKTEIDVVNQEDSINAAKEVIMFHEIVTFIDENNLSKIEEESNIGKKFFEDQKYPIKQLQETDHKQVENIKP